MDDLSGFEYLVVGAGISGATVARRLVERGKRVAIVEKTDRIGGLCHSFVDKETNIECHSFGSHILHSTDIQVIAFLSKFCRLNHYRHKVFSRIWAKVYPFPVNLQTINQFFGLSLSPAEARDFIKSQTKASLDPPTDFEGVMVEQIGEPLFNAFIRGYSEKHWGVSPRELPASLAQRIPIRFDYHSDYFDDPWQGIPLGGYRDLFSRLLEGIPTVLSVDFLKDRERVGGNKIIVYTGPLDEYFDFRFGPLPWRSVRLEFDVLPIQDYQGCSVTNFPSPSIQFTRIHEFRHLHPERRGSSSKTVIAREYPSGEGTPAYPVEPEGALAQRYRLLASLEKGVHFCGRLGNYRYLNMDQAVVEALVLAERI